MGGGLKFLKWERPQVKNGEIDTLKETNESLKVTMEIKENLLLEKNKDLENLKRENIILKQNLEDREEQIEKKQYKYI